MNLPHQSPAFSSRRLILDMPVCDFGWEDAFAFAENLSSISFGHTVIAFMNANNANLMMKDKDFRAALHRQVIFPDGYGVDIASWLSYGSMFPANLNGTDFVPALMTYMREPKRVAMIGARQDVLLRAARQFRELAPWHEFIPVSDGYFDREKSDEVLAQVREHQADILLVAMGSPAQEKWIDRHVGPGHARLVLSVGALFDFMAGEQRRAPLWVRRMRMEWFYRLLQEPGRLWRRYILGNPVFLYHVFRHWLTGMGGNPPRRGAPGRKVA